MVKEFNSTLWTVKKIFFYHIKIKLKNMDNWLAKTTQDVVFTGLNWAKNWCLTWRVLRMCWDIAETTIKHFFVSFSWTVSHKYDGNETTIPEVVFACFAMLSVSLCGTFNQFAVHENETEKRFIVIFATSQHILSMRHVRQQFPKIWSILLYTVQHTVPPFLFLLHYLSMFPSSSKKNWRNNLKKAEEKSENYCFFVSFP